MTITDYGRSALQKITMHGKKEKNGEIERGVRYEIYTVASVMTGAVRETLRKNGR